MIINLFSFSKRENSTAVPSGNGTAVVVNLKQPANILNPSFQLASDWSISTVRGYNYLNMDGAWYYIENWTSVRNNLWECSCSLDVLASFRSEIRATSAFVEYDTSGNTWLIDHRLSTLETGTRAGNTQAMSLVKTAGVYVVTVTGQEGSVGNYVLSESGLSSLMNSVRDWSDVDDEEEVLDVLKKWATKALSSGSAPNNIRGCRWIPWQISGSPQQIYLGTYPTGVSGQKITNPIVTGGVVMQIPWQVSDWRRCSLCHTFQLYLPYCGNVGIDAGILSGSEEIVVRWSADMRTGDIQFLVFSEDTNGLPIGSYAGCAGVDVPIGVASVNPLSQLGAVFNAGTQIASGNVIGANMGVAEVAQKILVPNMTAIGTQSSGASSGLNDNEYISLFSLFRNTNVSPSSVSAIMGTPTMAVKSLSGLSGFVKTRGFSVNVTAGKGVIDRINTMMDGGVYLE